MSKSDRQLCLFSPKLKAIAWACACVFSSAAGASSAVQSTTQLNQSRPSEEGSTFISAERMENTSEEVILSGDAEVRRSDTVIKGDKITYSQEHDEVQVQGNAVVIRRGMRFAGPELSYQITSQSGEMKNVQYQYAPRGIQGKTEHATFLSGKNTTFKNATLSTCRPGSKAWWIQADSLDINDESKMATARNASLHIAGVPVIGVPWAMFPTGTERQSGLLAPTFGMGSTRGIEFSQPIYWNIAPNYDYTFTPHIMSKRGVILGNEVRYMNEFLQGQINYDYLPEDKETKESRYSTSILANAHWKGIGLDVDWHRVSDGEYIEDFSGDLAETSNKILDQNVRLSYGQGFWNSQLSVEKNQPLIDEDGRLHEKPYEKVPQLRWQAMIADWHNFELTSQLEATHFSHPEREKAQGNRFFMQHALAYPMMGAGWFVTPKAMVTAVSYDLDHSIQDSQGATLVRSSSDMIVPTFSLDAGLTFERDASWFGAPATQTLEPRLFYVYTPYRDQSEMPNFDSSILDLSFAGLFTENIYSGHDRVSQANQLSMVLTTRYLNRDNGFEWFRASLGQRLYFEDQDVALNPGKNNLEGTTSASHSDWLASVNANLTQDLSIGATTQYSSVESRFTRINAGIRWQPRPSSVIGLFYRYNHAPSNPDDHIKQVDLAAQWPLTHSLYALGRVNYSLREDEPVQLLGGFEYAADCWALRVVAQRYITGEDKYDSSIYMQLELTGLGSVGTNPIEELRRNIPGYRPASAQPIRTGLYDYYE